MSSIKTEADFTKALAVPQDKSVFASIWFTALKELTEMQYGFRPKCDNSDSDFERFAALSAEIMGMQKTISTVGGIRADGSEAGFRVDPVNYQVIKCNYVVSAAGRGAVHYFLDEDATEMLQHTNLQWMDLDVFRGLPDTLTLKIPKGHCWMETLGEEHTIEDIMLARVKVPMARRLMLKQFGMGSRMDDPDTECFWWLASSRSELDKGVQNTTFGTFVIDGHTKLDDMMEKLDEWGAEHAAALVASVSPEILEQLDSDTRNQVMLELIKGGTTEKIELLHRSRDYIKDTLDPQKLIEAVKRNRSLMELMFKFVMLRASEQFSSISEERLPPGLKIQKTSAKAKEIHQKLWAAWGRRIFVKAPVLTAEEKKSPTRHLVHGFFRRQAYGVGNSLRKVIWIKPFWRGKVELG